MKGWEVLNKYQNIDREVNLVKVRIFRDGGGRIRSIHLRRSLVQHRAWKPLRQSPSRYCPKRKSLVMNNNIKHREQSQA